MAIVTQDQINALADGFLVGPSEIGLYEVIDEVKYELHIDDDREIKRLTLLAVRRMLERGVRAGCLDGSSQMVYFEETAPDAIIARLSREWDELGQLPSMGDHWYFDWLPD
jgi:hypothetical protein